MHDAWAAIYNEWSRATHLTSWSSCFLNAFSQITCRKIRFPFACISRERVLPWCVRHIIKYVIPFFQGLLCHCRLLFGSSDARRASFLQPERADAESVMTHLGFAFISLQPTACDVTFAWVQLKSARLFLEESPPPPPPPLSEPHQGTHWPFSCPDPSITLYKDQLGPISGESAAGAAVPYRAVSVRWCFT